MSKRSISMTGPARRAVTACAGLCLVLLALVSPARAADTVTVFAAASLKTALEAVADDFEADTGIDVTLSFAGSSALARQIEHGAPADLFISANPGWMDRLQDRDLIVADSRFDLLGNRLVLIAHGPDVAPVEIVPGMDLVGRLAGGRLAMALVEAVPAGIYGKSALDHLGIWREVAPHVAQADNVRAALAFVATGEAPLGIVYATDAVADNRVSVIATFPPDTHPAIVYPAAVVSARDSPQARAFLDHLTRPAARDIFERQGFGVIAD